jgi:hypothetical protein
VPYTIPPNTRAPLSAGYITDQNNTADVLAGMGAAYNVLNTAYAGGADPTGTADSAAAIQAAINAIPAAGGVVYLPPGTYKVASTLTCANKLYATIQGAGRWATILNFTGTGDCLRVYNSDITGIVTGGSVLDLTISGVTAGAGSCGLHYGDLRGGELRLAVSDFSGAGSIGVHFDNTFAWTEETFGYIWAAKCTQHVVFDVSGATTSTNSYGYTDLLVEINNARANQDGIVLQNGALLYNSRLTLRGNFAGDASAQTSAVLRITGTVPAGHPGAGTGSRINSCYLDLTAECGPQGVNAPQTIAFGTLGTNTLTGCTGVINFASGATAFTISNYTALGGVGTFLFSGIVRGDFNLNNGGVGLGGFPLFVTTQVIAFAKSLLNSANGNVSVGDGDFFSQTLTQSVTINLNPSGAPCPAAAQRKTVIIKQAAAGGPFTVTWPHTGSPTTSAPTVNWAGGTAPTMTAGAGATDVYQLVTYDGATWYGTASQNVS